MKYVKQSQHVLQAPPYLVEYVKQIQYKYVQRALSTLQQENVKQTDVLQELLTVVHQEEHANIKELQGLIHAHWEVQLVLAQIHRHAHSLHQHALRAPPHLVEYVKQIQQQRVQRALSTLQQENVKQVHALQALLSMLQQENVK